MGIVALVVTLIVVLTGGAAVVFLLSDGRPLPAILAFLLSAAFSVVIAMLVPPTRVALREHDETALLITQASNVSFPIVTYAIGTPDGALIGRVRRSVWSRLGRNRWHILSANGEMHVGHAVEESLSRAMLRKIAGKYSRRYESNIRILFDGKHAGWIFRRPGPDGQVDVLDVTGDIDRRLAVGLTTLILGTEP